MNALLGHKRIFHTKLASRSYEFYLEASNQNYQSDVFFNVAIGDYKAYISLSKFPQLGFFIKELEGVKVDKLPEELRKPFIEAAWDKGLKSIESALGVSIKLLGFSQNPPIDLYEHTLFFRGAPDIAGMINLSTPALEYFSVIIQKAERIPNVPLSLLPISARTIIGRMQLKLDDFSNLHLNDILLCSDLAKFAGDGSCCVMIQNHFLYTSKLKNNKLTLGKSMADAKNANEYEAHDEDQMEELTENTEEVAQTESSELGAHPTSKVIDVAPQYKDLPLNLLFEIGQKKISLEELQSVQTGYTFELDSSLQTPVTIRANGKKIGTGELLKVGDRVGVRVASFY